MNKIKISKSISSNPKPVYKSRTHLLHVTILKYIFEKHGGGADWIHLNQNRDQWRALVDTVMNLKSSINLFACLE
jgi:hypothetical protein